MPILIKGGSGGGAVIVPPARGDNYMTATFATAITDFPAGALKKNDIVTILDDGTGVPITYIITAAGDGSWANVGGVSKAVLDYERNESTIDVASAVARLAVADPPAGAPPFLIARELDTGDIYLRVGIPSTDSVNWWRIEATSTFSLIDGDLSPLIDGDLIKIIAEI